MADLTPTPTFQGETQFVTFADSSKGGPRITLRLADREALEAFIGAEGQRFACVLVRIGDDEQPAPPEPKKRSTGDGEHVWAKWAAIWCNDERFRAWLAMRFMRFNRPVPDERTAAAVLREVCEVDSRARFDDTPDARQRFFMRIRDPWKDHFNSKGWTE